MASTIPGAGSTTVTFSVPGSNSAGNNYLADFAAAVANTTSVATLPSESSAALGLNEYIGGAAINTVLTTGNQYTLLETFAPSILQLNASNETVAAAGSVTIQELGTVGGEKVIFISGNNTFEGSSTGVGGDTISGGSGFDTIDTGGGPTTVFSGAATDITLSNTVSGDLAVVQDGMATVAADGLADTISAAAGADLTFSNLSSDFAVISAGAGNETLDGAGALGGFALFADTVSGSVGTDSVTGGSGYNFFSTGTGTEDYTAGSGSAYFEIASVAGGAITINDFGAFDSVNFAGLTVAEESALGSSTTASSITVTLGNGTTVDFVGITSLSGHLS